MSESNQKEMETLQKRLDLRAEQLSRVDDWLIANEEAMTALDYSAAAIADMKTVKGKATANFETTMKELERLVEQAKYYNTE